MSQLMVPDGSVSHFNRGSLALRDEAQFKCGQLWLTLRVNASRSNQEFQVVRADGAVKDIGGTHRLHGSVHAVRQLRSHRWKVGRLLWRARKNIDRVRLTGSEQAGQTNDNKTFHRRTSLAGGRVEPL